MIDLELLDQFLTHIRVERGLSKATEGTYRYQLKGYLKALGRWRITFVQVSKETIRRFLTQKKSDGLKSSSLFNLTLAIRQFHRFLFEEKLSLSDPTVGLKLPKFQQRIPEPLTAQAMDKLLSGAQFEKFTLVRTHAMIECAFGLGLRASELVGLKLDDLHLGDGWIRVANAKGGRERILPIGGKVSESLKQYLLLRKERFGGKSDVVFLSARGKPINRGTFWWLLKTWAQRAGIKERVSPHQLRHSFATELISQGASLRGVQVALGHRSLELLTRYAHVNFELLRDAFKKHPRFN